MLLYVEQVCDMGTCISEGRLAIVLNPRYPSAILTYVLKSSFLCSWKIPEKPFDPALLLGRSGKECNPEQY